MKFNIIGMVGILIVIVMSLIGCTNSENADNTQGKILDSVKPVAEQWFETNMPDVKDVSVELCEFDKLKEFYGVVTGFYSKNEKQYCYWLNVDTEEFCSEEYFDILMQSMQARLADGLGFECKEIDILPEVAVIHGKEGYSKSCKWASYRFSDEELDAMVDKEMSKADMEIQIIVAEPDKIIADITALDILKEHSNWTFVLKEDREEPEYRVYYSEGKYYTARAFYDENGILRYDIKTIEAPEL